jgi:hypothetical protein
MKGLVAQRSTRAAHSAQRRPEVRLGFATPDAVAFPDLRQLGLNRCRVRIPDHAAHRVDNLDPGVIRMTVVPLKRPPKRPDRAYPLVKNQEYAYAYDWEHGPG